MLRKTTSPSGVTAMTRVRQLKGSALQALTEERIGFAKYFLKDGSGVLDIPRSKQDSNASVDGAGVGPKCSRRSLSLHADDVTGSAYYDAVSLYFR